MSEDIKRRILACAIRHAGFDGWGEATLARAAAETETDPATARRLFPGGRKDLVVFHLAEADREMAEALAAADLAGLGVRARIVFAVRGRLERAEPHREAVRRAFAYLALPANAGLSARSLYSTVDAIWHAIGDRSTDFNFYTKRGLLAGVYLSTVLYWLGDGSERRQDTWAFLDRRIADVMRIEKAKGRLRRVGERVPSPWRLLARLRHGMGAAARM